MLDEHDCLIEGSRFYRWGYFMRALPSQVGPRDFDHIFFLFSSHSFPRTLLLYRTHVLHPRTVLSLVPGMQ